MLFFVHVFVALVALVVLVVLDGVVGAGVRVHGLLDGVMDATVVLSGVSLSHPSRHQKTTLRFPKTHVEPLRATKSHCRATSRKKSALLTVGGLKKPPRATPSHRATFLFFKKKKNQVHASHVSSTSEFAGDKVR